MADEHADDFEALILHEDIIVSLVVPCIADKHHVPEIAWLHVHDRVPLVPFREYRSSKYLSLFNSSIHLKIIHRKMRLCTFGPNSATQSHYCRAPSVSCATRLKLSVCLFLFFSPGISSQPLNLSQQKFAR